MVHRFIGFAALLLSSACTFSNVRSAEVTPGLTLRAQASLASPPGEEAYWFFALENCACNDAIPTIDVGIVYGIAASATRPAWEWELGLDGFSGYVGGYRQLRADERGAFGVGARLGVPWPVPLSHSHVYLRKDHVLSGGERLLLTPALVLRLGNSPNGENPGGLVALVQGVGLELRGRGATLIPSAALAVGSGYRESYGVRHGPFAVLFGTVALAVSFHGPR